MNVLFPIMDDLWSLVCCVQVDDIQWDNPLWVPVVDAKNRSALADLAASGNSILQHKQSNHSISLPMKEPLPGNLVKIILPEIKTKIYVLGNSIKLKRHLTSVICARETDSLHIGVYSGI